MAPFIFAFLFVFSVAIAVVAAFALPHLRAGSRVLTPKGERVARETQGRIRRVNQVGLAGVDAVRGRLARPGTAQPSTAQPSTAQPSTAQPSTAQPSTAHAAGDTAQAAEQPEPGDGEAAAVLIQKQVIAAPSRPGAVVPASIARR